MNSGCLNVLFLCTGNSARSIIAEAILNSIARRKFQAYSAGSQPTGKVHPFALELLEKNRLAVDGARSKDWSEFSKPGAAQLDFVFTVCDNAANEVCPVWPGRPVTAHWGVEDPSMFEGTDEQKRKEFSRVALILKRRIELFTSLPLARLDRLMLQRNVRNIGKVRE